VWVLGTFFCRGLGFVAASRTTSSNGLYIVQNGTYKFFPESSMNSHQTELTSIHEEYYKLRKNKRNEARRIAATSIKDILPHLSLLQDVVQNFSYIPDIDIDLDI
jgi:hypothetical protein